MSADARKRLDALCDSLTEALNDSPYSREEWARLDDENARLRRDLAVANARILQLESARAQGAA